MKIRRQCLRFTCRLGRVKPSSSELRIPPSVSENCLIILKIEAKGCHCRIGNWVQNWFKPTITPLSFIIRNRQVKLCLQQDTFLISVQHILSFTFLPLVRIYAETQFLFDGHILNLLGLVNFNRRSTLITVKIGPPIKIEVFADASNSEVVQCTTRCVYDYMQANKERESESSKTIQPLRRYLSPKSERKSFSLLCRKKLDDIK